MTAPTPELSTPRTVWLVADREIRMRLRSVSYIVSTVIMLAVVLGGIILTSIDWGGSERIAVVDGVDTTVLEATEDLEIVPVADAAAAEEAVLAGEVPAAVIPDDGPLGVAILAERDIPGGLVQLLSVSPPVELLDPDAINPAIGYLIAVAFGIVFLFSASMFGGTIAQSVVEEKSTRVIEILLAAIPTRALLAGKILGTSILAFAQVALIAATAIIGLTATGQNELLAGLGAPVVWFVGFYLVGFVLLAAMFSATAAMVSRMEDIGTTTTPVTMLIMLPYFVVIFFNDDPLILGITSYVPFSAPIAMPLRLFLGTAEWWEPLVALAILLGTTALVIAIAARIYERSLLKLGARVGWREALTG